MADQTCPPIPAGGVDINALHEAALKGKDLNEVIAPAPTPETPQETGQDAKPPKGTPPADPTPPATSKPGDA